MVAVLLQCTHVPIRVKCTTFRRAGVCSWCRAPHFTSSPSLLLGGRGCLLLGLSPSLHSPFAPPLPTSSPAPFPSRDSCVSAFCLPFRCSFHGKRIAYVSATGFALISFAALHVLFYRLRSFLPSLAHTILLFLTLFR
ncbi:hypothetical protein PTSG_12499 [Salpingoeca rosetta]|uniref:Transmembrane protein n=1 Tax=Salpingoeca rosetta (strain ATCC 50818 / BSB-021) TaxID=946362 RepID=F2UF22_SALR5|nr:uncharacterized protein PTSG_12499 [Salpingoeca rosetta]EGD75222.1 hypothetical protein PTSG_12499 [Salpingoeca rosetta]|eukprot:XP_004992275.1 hypothetical protein PTSG_12499 [Salpingoeca rosetta]